MKANEFKKEETMNFTKKKEYAIDKYKLKISLNEELIFLEIVEEKDSPINTAHNKYINLDQFKKIDNYFIQFADISDIFDSFEELINMNLISIIKEENNKDNLKIKIKNPVLKNKEFYIDIPLKEKSIQNEIDSIISYINKLNDKINNIETKFEKRISFLENQYKKMENKENAPMLINSTILEKNKDFSFLDNRLKSYFNGDIKYELIYRATKDGPKTSDFNRCCNGKNNQLIILKTKKGIIFGGFTGRGFQNTNNREINDDSVFLFSLDNQKIYNIKKGSDAIYELSKRSYGIFFGKCDGNNPIYLGAYNCDMLNYNSSTCNNKNSEFYFTKDYELNNGEHCFSLSEIEVFQIIRFN